MITLLTNNFTLSVRSIREDEVRLIDIPIGSKLQYIKKTSGYHAYYEMNTYSLQCLFDKEKVMISCSMYKGGNEPWVNCIKGNLFSNKKHYWSETFNEDFPE